MLAPPEPHAAEHAAERAVEHAAEHAEEHAADEGGTDAEEVASAASTPLLPEREEQEPAQQ
eukprot:4616043-Lingulodinium_polyedra.AAC.1